MRIILYSVVVLRILYLVAIYLKYVLKMYQKNTAHILLVTFQMSEKIMK